jgi:hypothetical protein
MQRRSGIGAVGVAAAAVVVTASAYGASAAPRSGGASHVLDSTYSCLVRPERYVDLDASVTIKPEPGRIEPAQARVTTVPKTMQSQGVDYNVPQILFQAAKNSVRVDQGICRRSSRKVALVPSGLPAFETVTPSFVGDVQARCTTTKRVLVRFRIAMKNHTPQRALIAVRDDNAKLRKLAFFNWKPGRIASWLARSCVSLSG